MSRAHEPHDEGFGLVEVIVAIVILGLLAVAVLPMIWTGLRVATEQSTVATATQLVSGVIDEARSKAPAGCTTLNIARATEDGRGTTINLAGTYSGTCDDTVRPFAIKYTATATDGAGKQLAQASTLIFLPAPPEEAAG